MEGYFARERCGRRKEVIAMRSGSAVPLLASTVAFLACAKCPPPAEPRQESHVVAAPPAAPPSSTTEARPTELQASAATACTGTPTNITPRGQLATFSREDATCTLDTEYLRSIASHYGSAAAGESCSKPTQCAPSCCACSDGTTAVMTSLCRNGRCSSAMDTCCALAGTKTHSCGQLP